eukprot:429000_1
MIRDLKIFHKEENECVPSDYIKCDGMKRLISSSEYHSKVKNSADFHEILTRFMNEVYNGEGKKLIDDYIHFQVHHEHELERINRDLIESNRFGDCSISKCGFTRRHMSVHKQRTSTTASDTKLCFYGETFDALHFHLFHCFEAGLRMGRNDANDKMEEQEKATNVYFDSQFARLNRRILERRDNTASFDRFAPKNTKFNILNAEQLKRDTKQNSSTYLDEMVKHLLNSRVEEMCIKQFMQFINQQQYDTDAIDHDHAMKPNRNISS